MNLFDIDVGTQFHFDYDENTVYKLIKHGDDDTVVIRTYWKMDGVWHHSAARMEERANPYCGIYKVKVSTQVEKE